MDVLRRAHRWNVVLFVTFVLAILLVYTGIWQLAFAAGFVGGFVGKRGRRDFVLGFVGTAFAWGGHLAWLYANRPAAAVTELFAEILGLSAGAAIVVPVLTLLIGGLAGGLGALLGAYVGQLAVPTRAETGSAKT